MRRFTGSIDIDQGHVKTEAGMDGETTAFLFGRFVGQESDAPLRIAECLTGGRDEEARRIANAVKNMAGDLGARELWETAATLEASIAASASPADIKSELRTLEDILGGLFARLRTAIEDLRSSLDRRDPGGASVRFRDALALAMPADVRAGIDEARRLTDGHEYEAAAAVVAAMAAASGIPVEMTPGSASPADRTSGEKE
jgi:hypothetical protein